MHLLSLPHRTRQGMCPVNGIRDLIQWRTGRDWSKEFVWGLGQGGGFAYLRFQQIQESEVLARFDSVWSWLAEVNTVFSDEEITTAVQAARSSRNSTRD